MKTQAQGLLSSKYALTLSFILSLVIFRKFCMCQGIEKGVKLILSPMEFQSFKSCMTTSMIEMGNEISRSTKEEAANLLGLRVIREGFTEEVTFGREVSTL